jgi:hypothetical protein
MPVPKATGTHGNSRPAPASARAQARKRSINLTQMGRACRRQRAGLYRPPGRPSAGNAPSYASGWSARRLVRPGHELHPAMPVSGLMLSRGAWRQRERFGNTGRHVRKVARKPQPVGCAPALSRSHYKRARDRSPEPISGQSVQITFRQIPVWSAFRPRQEAWVPLGAAYCGRPAPASLEARPWSSPARVAWA